MKNRFFIYCLFLMVSFHLQSCCCDSDSEADRSKHDNGAVMAMLYQQKAAEYRALCLQAYNLARWKVDEIAAKGTSGKKPAIITDLDETALDNSSSSAWAYLHNTTSTLAVLQDWWIRGIADSVPGSVSFFNYAAGKGFDIYYISNRPDSGAVVKATMRNMKSLGFPFTDDKDAGHFLFLKPNTPFNSKEDRRKSVQSIDTVVLLLGDNLADMDAAFDGKPREARQIAVDKLVSKWGSRYIVFPNPGYGDWENALYRNFHTPPNPTIQQKDSMRVLLLDTMEIDKNTGW